MRYGIQNIKFEIICLSFVHLQNAAPCYDEFVSPVYVIKIVQIESILINDVPVPSAQHGIFIFCFSSNLIIGGLVKGEVKCYVGKVYKFHKIY